MKKQTKSKKREPAKLPLADDPHADILNRVKTFTPEEIGRLKITLKNAFPSYTSFNKRLMRMISVCRSAGRDDANIIGFLGVMVNPVWHGNTDHAAILRKEASQAVTKSKTESGKARAKSAPRDANGAFQKKFQKKKKNPLTAYEGKQRYAAG